MATSRTDTEGATMTTTRKGLNTRIAEALDAAGYAWQATLDDDDLLVYVIDPPNACTIIASPGAAADLMEVAR